LGQQGRIVKMGRFFARIILIVAASLALFTTAEARQRGIDLTPEQQQAVEDVNAYFNSFTNLRGDFTQPGNSGNVTSGVVLISKPGKMRFEYAPPNPFVVVSDGRWVAVVNRNKRAADQYPLSVTPLRLLLGEHMDLLKSAVINAVDMQDGLITIHLEDKDQMVSGELVLIFDSNANTLKQWVVIDGQGRRTTISLDKLVMNQPADPKLFWIDIDRRTGKSSD
jgi:outer membrane lipoprotein-sorting protein